MEIAAPGISEALNRRPPRGWSLAAGGVPGLLVVLVLVLVS